MLGLTAGHMSFASPAHAVPGLVRTTAASVSDSSATKTVAAICPSGTRVVGGGGDVLNGDGQVVPEQLQPAQTVADERFTVSASEDETVYADNWQLTAYALCADPIPGQQIVSVGQPPASDPLQSGASRMSGVRS